MFRFCAFNVPARVPLAISAYTFANPVTVPSGATYVVRMLNSMEAGA
jgi:hypothetical protein